jgi:hypothetical protein
MKVLVDADLVLVACLNQGEWEEEVEKLWEMMESGSIQGHITEVGLDRVRFVVSNFEKPEIVDQVFFDIQEVLQILPIERSLFEQARLLNLLDFDSAMEVACAIAKNIGAIVTLTPQNFDNSPLSVLSVTNLLERQCLESLAISTEENTDTASDEDPKPNISPSECHQNSVKLSEWLHNPPLGEGWMRVEDILKMKLAFSFRAASIRENGSIRAKQIDLGNGCLVALVVHITPENNSEVDMNILLQLYALGDKQYLPENIKLLVLNESGDIFCEVKSRGDNIGIQSALIATLGDGFSVKIYFNDVIFIENFIV